MLLTELILIMFAVKEASPVNLEAEVDYVIYGSEANIKWDKTHELILGNKLWDMKEVDLAQVMLLAIIL